MNHELPQTLTTISSHNKESAADQTVTAGRSERGSRQPRLVWKLVALMAVIFVAVFSWRANTGHAKPQMAASGKVPVAVAEVTREDLAQELVCDSELRPYQEIDLHAKVAGYLESITVDIGDRVQTGQLLATIEVPELGDDIKRAEAAIHRNEQEVARAQAGYNEAHLVYSRLVAVEKSKPNLIAQQELDAANEKEQISSSTLAAAKAEVDVSRAEIAKLQTMLKYSRIVAPFPGVITKRYADPGALIQAGISSSTQTLPVVRLSQNDRLRLDIPVPVSSVSRIKLGEPVEIRVESCGKKFTGRIARSTRKVETSTRTMDVEVDVPNDDLELIPGMYAAAQLKLERREQILAVPIQAVSRQKTSATVYVVNRENKIEERVVMLGLETPQKIEVLGGLSEKELVMIGSRTQLKPGQEVDPKLIELSVLAE